MPIHTPKEQQKRLVEQQSLEAPAGSFLGGLIPQGASGPVDFTASILDAVLGVPKAASAEEEVKAGTQKLGESIGSLLDPDSKYNLLDLAGDMINPSTGEMDFAGLLPGVRAGRRASRVAAQQDATAEAQRQQIRGLQIEKLKQQVTGKFERKREKRLQERTVFSRVLSERLREARKAKEAGRKSFRDPIAPITKKDIGGAVKSAREAIKGVGKKKAARRAAVSIAGKPNQQNFQQFNQVREAFERVVEAHPEVEITAAYMATAAEVMGPHGAFAIDPVEIIGGKVANKEEVAAQIRGRLDMIESLSNQGLIQPLDNDTFVEILKAAGVPLNPDNTFADPELYRLVAGT